ncbi:hypothetical protein CTI12_AA202170 [Artemisia annua]|uniref:Uncharacterized protein n=1 Tax=Artemisia annua TaxID=35608 RepID=A0A2U1P220_ARTAN|nr:hypothetical protein CTI12_AA202170 [Artemisia annua]
MGDEEEDDDEEPGKTNKGEEKVGKDKEKSEPSKENKDSEEFKYSDDRLGVGSLVISGSKGKGTDEGNPSKRELGESSASLPKILPVTGEPIHHTIPLLATRIARHEDRLNDVVNVINGLPCGHITEDVNNLIIGQMAVESKVEQIKTEFSESMEFIAALCTANVTMGDVLTSFDHELEQISAQNFSLRRAIQESYAREWTRDRTIETLTTKITELQRRMDEVSGKP